MPDTRNPAAPQASEPPAGDRLDSWKEIAAFLQRDVRTVQRWEKYAGLPVHRHAESRLRTAYAYRSELEAWWRAQRNMVEAGQSPEPEAGAEARQEGPRRRRILALLGATAAAVGIAGAIWFAARRPAADAAIARRPILVVLAAFDNNSAGTAVTTAVEQAVSRELARRGLEFAPPAAVARTLRLMRRDPQLRLTETVARDLASRDRRIRFVITGRVDALDSRYFAALRAVDAEGRTRASVEWRSDTAGALMAGAGDALDRFTRLMVQAAGAMPDPARPLEPVTSSSTESVGLYTAALQAGLRGEWGPSELLARRAVALDSGFAAAHALIGWAMWRQGRTAAESLPHLRRAGELTGEMTVRESYLISGMLHSAAGDLPAASASLEALLRLDEADPLALEIVTEVYNRMGRVRRAVDLSVRRAESHPDDFHANVRAAHALAVGAASPDRAAAYAARARQLAAADTFGDRPSWNAWLHVLPVFQRWMAGDRQAALDELDRIDRSLADRLGRDRDAFAAAVGFAHLAFGRTREAEQAFRYGSTPDREMNLAVLALGQEDERTARRWIGQVRAHAARRPELFARLGLLDDAERGLAALPPSDHAEGIAAVTRGLIAARRGQTARATAALREGRDLLRASGEQAYFFAVEALARMAEGSGDIERSLRLLADAARERKHTYGLSQWTAANWIRINADLAQRSRRAGRNEEADRITAELRQILDGVELPSAAVRTLPAGR